MKSIAFLLLDQQMWDSRMISNKLHSSLENMATKLVMFFNTLLQRLNFQGTRTEEDETRALLPKTNKLDARCPSNAQDSLLNPSKEETGCTKKQRGQWQLHQSSRQPLEPLTQCVKYLTIVWNLAFSIAGLLIFAIGIWGLYDKESLTTERITYLGSDPMLFFVLAGLAASTMSLVGCTGAFIENTCLLKLFTGGIITFVILEVLGGIVLFSLRHQINASLQESLMVAVLRYQDDLDLQFIMDEIQTGLQCCGVESYLDWKTNVHVTKGQHHLLVSYRADGSSEDNCSGCTLKTEEKMASLWKLTGQHTDWNTAQIQAQWQGRCGRGPGRQELGVKEKCIACPPGLSQAQGMRGGTVSELKGHLNIFNHFAFGFCVLLLLSPSEVAWISSRL